MIANSRENKPKKRRILDRKMSETLEDSLKKEYKIFLIISAEEIRSDVCADDEDHEMGDGRWGERG